MIYTVILLSIIPVLFISIPIIVLVLDYIPKRTRDILVKKINRLNIVLLVYIEVLGIFSLLVYKFITLI